MEIKKSVLQNFRTAILWTAGIETKSLYLSGKKKYYKATKSYDNETFMEAQASTLHKLPFNI